MARRATSPSQKQTTAQTTALAKMSEPAGAEVPRRGRKSESTISEPAEPSLTDIFFPGGEGPADVGAEVGSSLPVKARHGRNPKAPDKHVPASIAADNGAEADSAPPEVTQNSDGPDSPVTASKNIRVDQPGLQGTAQSS